MIWPRQGPEPASARQIEVAQGAFAVSDDPNTELCATLGSCVAVCLFAPQKGIGAMNHIFQNVSAGAMGEAVVVAEVERLVNALMRRGVPRSEMHARVAGGAKVLLRGKMHGLAMAEVCLRYLEEERIPLQGLSIGGEQARRIQFHPVTGKLTVGMLAKVRFDDLPTQTPKGNAPEMF